MENKTVTSYIANSVHLDGVRAEEIKKSLAADVTEELLHGQTMVKRVKETGGSVPGSMGFTPVQKSLQPPVDTTDVVAVSTGVIEICGEVHDYVTQDLCITQLSDEEGHRLMFVGFLKEYTKG